MERTGQNAHPSQKNNHQSYMFSLKAFFYTLAYLYQWAIFYPQKLPILIIYDLCFNNFPHPPNNSIFPHHFETLWFVLFELLSPRNLLVVPVNAFILTHLCLTIPFRFFRSSSSFFFLVAVPRSTAVFLSNSLQDRIRIISPFFSKSSNVMWVTDRVAVSNA